MFYNLIKNVDTGLMTLSESIVKWRVPVPVLYIVDMHADLLSLHDHVGDQDWVVVAGGYVERGSVGIVSGEGRFIACHELDELINVAGCCCKWKHRVVILL